MRTISERCATHRPIDSPHDFDPDSGWCIHGCGHRDDGRVISRGGTTLRQPQPGFIRQLPEPIVTPATALIELEDLAP